MKKSKQLINYVKYTVLISFINTMAYGQCSLTSGPNHSVINYECPQDILYITATVAYNGVLAKGRAYTKFGAGNGGQYKKPLIMVEGLDLDIGDNHDQGHRIGDRGWPNFITGISNEREPNDHILDDLPILINNLNSKGYDLIYFDHEDGATYMQANAMALVELIKEINNHKVGNEPITLVGASMGGQIVKYALSYMEKNNIKHCVNEYISFDSPHQGAYMPVSLQKFVDHFAPLSQKIATMRDKLNLPAPQQLLSLHAAGGFTGASNLRTTWLADLAALGTYPTKTRNVAIVNGSGNATEIFAKGSPMMGINLTSPSLCNELSALNATLKGCGATDTYTGKRPKGENTSEIALNYFACDINCFPCKIEPSLFFDVKTLDTPSSKNYDGCAGSFRDTQDAFFKVIQKALQDKAGDLGLSLTGLVTAVQQPNHSFVSTVSALDMNTTNLAYNVNANVPNKLIPSPAQHPFDAIYAPAGNEFHVAFNPSNIQWIIEEMGSIESKLGYVNYILTTNTALAPVYNIGVYNFARPESRRLLRSMSIIAGGKLYVNANNFSDFGSITPGSLPHNPTGIPYVFPIAGSTYTLETCDCGNTEVKVDNNGEFIIGDNNTPINNKAVVLFHEGSTLRVKNGGKLTIRSGSKLIMEQNTNLIVEQGGQIIIEGGGELVLKANSNATNSGQITLNSNALLTQQPNSILTLNNLSQLIVNDNARVLVSTLITASAFNDNAVLNYNQGAGIQLKGNNAVLELNGRLNIGNNAIFNFTYPGSNSGYIYFNRGNGVWWDNWTLPNNTHITCGTGASFKLVGQSKTDKIIVINQIDLAMPKNLQVCSINKGLVEFKANDARFETSVQTIFTNSTFKGIAPAMSNIGRGVEMYGQPLFIVTSCDFLNLGTGITGSLYYGGNSLAASNNLFKECGVGIGTWGAGVNLQYNTFLNNAIAIANQGLEYNSSVANNTITAPAYPSDPVMNHTTIGVLTSGNNGVYNLSNNVINRLNTGIYAINNNVKLRCNDLTYNDFVLCGSTNSKINMSSLLDAGYNNASNSLQFAHFEEADFFEANEGYNSFKILNSTPCYTTTLPLPWHPVVTVCPTIADGSINNYTSYNSSTGKYELLAGLNYWRPLTSAGNTIESEYFNIIKTNLGYLQYGQLITGTPLSTISQVACPIIKPDGGSAGRVQQIDPLTNSSINNYSSNTKDEVVRVTGAGEQHIHPLASNSDNSIITTKSFSNKKIQFALQSSMNVMENTQDVKKLNQAADLLTEILKYNYTTPVVNPNDHYLLELSYQKLFSNVSQLTEAAKNTAGSNAQPASIAARHADLHNLNALRLSRKNKNDINYKEVSDLNQLDDALIYGLSGQRTKAISIINKIIAGNPKSEHLSLFEHWRCIYSIEDDAIKNIISADEAMTKLKNCNLSYLPVRKKSDSNSTRMINNNKPDEMFDAKDNAIAVYPNPTEGSLLITYDLTEFKNITFEIVDIQGKKIVDYHMNPDEYQFSIDNLNLDNGVYIYNLKADGKNLMTKKLVVVK